MIKKLIQKLKPFSVLYVEDEDSSRKNINEILEIFFNKIYLAKDGEEAYQLYMEKKPDLIITDIRMPKINGIELVQKIRKIDDSIRVIMLSAYTDLDYILTAVELHLVKYIVKPISEDKLYDALNAFLGSYKKSKFFNLCPSWSFDENNCLIKGPEKEFNLTKKETLFLKYMISKKRLVTYEEIEYIIWSNEHTMSDNAIRLFIRNLRKKLPKKLLVNVTNSGYKLSI